MSVKDPTLKAYLNAKKSSNRLIGDVERYLLSRPPGDRSTTVLHPSEIIKKDWCLRESWFLLSGHKKIADTPGLKLQSIFDEGHAIHAKWQRWFQDMGVLHGQFRCQVCNEITWGTSPEMCGSCTAPRHTLYYEEVTLRDDDLRIKGHTDGWIKGIGDDCLIEIKSIGPGTLRFEAPTQMYEAYGDFMKAWTKVTHPFQSHVLQGQMYLELMKRMGNPIDEIVFIYELKADQSYKEFSVKADYRFVEKIFDNARIVVDAVEAGIPLACNVDESGACKKCAPYKEKQDAN
jgi:hypothetical protein